MQYNRDSTKYAKELARRTRENLKNYEGPYEITQLINSMVGVLIVPRSLYLENFANVAFDRTLLQNVQGCCDQNQPLPLEVIVRRMRNAISHSRLEFHADNNGNINYIVFRDVGNSRRGIRPFRMDIPIDLLRDFIQALFDAIETFPNSSTR